MRFGWLVALAYLATLTHPLFDLLTTYSVQLLSPFSGRWFHADALFIIDLWLWLLLGASIAWSRMWESKGMPWRRPAQAAIAILLAYVSINLLITQRAYAGVRDWAGKRPIDALFASPPPVQSWRRGLVWREGHCYRWSRYDPLAGGFGEVTACRPNRMDDPLVREAVRLDPELRGFLRWSVLPLAEVERSRCSATVSIGDARYQDFGTRSRLRHETRVPTGGLGC
jgi:inner membrane protein